MVLAGDGQALVDLLHRGPHVGDHGVAGSDLDQRVGLLAAGGQRGRAGGDT
jgi:hypothetical protein